MRDEGSATGDKKLSAFRYSRSPQFSTLYVQLGFFRLERVRAQWCPARLPGSHVLYLLPLESPALFAERLHPLDLVELPS